MRRTSRSTFAVTLLALAAACSSGASAQSAPRPARVPPGDVPPLAQRYADYAGATFDASAAEVDNPYLPLRPGLRQVLVGSDRHHRSHRIEVVVTDLVQVVDGVPTTVVWERDFDGRALVEAELSYYAQDARGTVWHMGEYAESYDDGELVGGTGWLQGHLDGARAGIIMPADPRPGTPSYSEGYGPPPINWTDRAKVTGRDLSVRVPAGRYHDVVVIDEYSEQERTGFQRKYYAPGVGNVKVGWRGHDEAREVLGLRSSVQLGPVGLERARAAARALEARARMYGSTPASQVRTG
jgi:hypothetical protein